MRRLDAAAEAEHQFGDVRHLVARLAITEDRLRVGGGGGVALGGVGIGGGEEPGVAQRPAVGDTGVVLGDEFQAVAAHLAEVLGVAGAGAADVIDHDQVVEVGVKGHRLHRQGPIGVGVARAQLIGQAGLFLDAADGALRAGRGETTVDAGKTCPSFVELIGGTEAGGPQVHGVVAGLGRAVIVLEGLLQLLEAHPRCEAPGAGLDGVLQEHGHGIGLLQAVAGAAGGTRGHGVDGATGQLAVIVIPLEAAHLVLVEADAGRYLVLHRAGAEAVIAHHIDALGLVIAVVGAHAQGTGQVTAQAVQTLATLRPGQGRRELDGVAIDVAQVLQFVPVTREGIAVQGDDDIRIIRGRHRVAQVIAPLRALDIVEAAGRVAAEGVGSKIGLAQPQIGLVGVQLGAAVFEFEALIDGGIRLPGQLDHRFRLGEAGVVTAAKVRRLIDGLVAIILAEIALQQKSHLPRAGVESITHIGVGTLIAIAAVGGLHIGGLLQGNGRGEIVDDTTGRLRAVLDLTGALENLQPAHAAHSGRIVSSWG